MPSRNEQYLEAAVNKSGTDGLPEPRTRNEKLLHRLVEEVSSGGLPEGGSPYQQLVTDGSGNTKWEDRLAYDDSRVVVDVNDNTRLVRVSDEVPSFVSDGVSVNVWLSNGTSQAVSVVGHGNGNFGVDEFVFIFSSDNVAMGNGIVFPKKGVYFVEVVGEVYVTGFSSADSDTPEITWDGKVENVKTIDPKYIKDMYYDSIAEIDIAGLEIEFPLVSVGADVSVPLELGQKWNLVVEDSRVQQNIDSSNPYEVKKNDEGILYIGADPSVNVINGNVRYDIVSITQSKAYYSQSFCSAVGYHGNMKIVGVSGVFTGKVVKTIDSKYIPADYINSLIDAKLGVIENGSY